MPPQAQSPRSRFKRIDRPGRSKGCRLSQRFDGRSGGEISAPIADVFSRPDAEFEVRAATLALGSGAGLGLVLAGGWIDLKRTEETQTAAEAFWQAGKPVAIAVKGGRASLRAPAGSPGSEILVIVSALSRERGPFSVEISARPATGMRFLLADIESGRDGTGPGPLCDRARLSRRARGARRAKEPAGPGGFAPAKERVFHMLVRDGDVYSPSNYLAVPAALLGVGRRIQVYVASRISVRCDPRQWATSSRLSTTGFFP